MFPIFPICAQRATVQHFANQNVHAVTQGHRVICYFVLLTYTYNLHFKYDMKLNF